MGAQRILCDQILSTESISDILDKDKLDIRNK